MISSGGKKSHSKKKKDKKVEPKKDLPPQVVTRQLGDNTYTGIIREDPLGSQFLETGSAKYTWNTGIRYEGPFASSQIEGKGKFSWPDGSSYEGELHNGKRHGEGLYIGRDGTTRYEGQWCMGKREGHGCLTYGASGGTAHYAGEWKDGKKHGQGKQVWPSGNVYEGQWVLGKMSGFGTMTWRMGGCLEQYKGFWEDNFPHGEGTHTWLAGEPLAEGGADARPVLASQIQQQQNNRYSGQWHRGKREGLGTFYYANGAYYYGEWKNHKKQGFGRHTFEDGHIYEGPFDDDRMTDYTPPTEVDENPVCKRIDISDLRVIALPKDHAGFEVTAGCGYLDPAKILREVYNTLLRNLSELKELYNRYRIKLPMPGEDPFILQNHQLWMFARDAGLATPHCPLSRINRFVFNGPRHHREVAPEDGRNLRPLTPRPHENRGSIDSVSDISGMLPDHNSHAPSPQVSQGESSEEEESASRDSEMPSPAHATHEGNEPKPCNNIKRTATPTDLKDNSGSRFICRKVLTVGALADPQPSEEAEELDGSSKADVEASVQSQGAESSKVTTEIHHPTKSLLFRQFLDGVVRISLARYPHERGLEAQIHRLFKEQVLPVCDKVPASEEVWSFLVRQEFRKTLKEFEPALLGLFRGAVVGRDADKLDDPRSMHRFSEFGAPQRQSRVLARVDETVRLKDVLRLFGRLGLLRPILASTFPSDNLCVPVVVEEEVVDDGNLSADENGSGGSNSPEQDINDSEEKAATPPRGEDVMSTFDVKGVVKRETFNGAPFDSETPFGVGSNRLSFIPKSSLLGTASEDGNPVSETERSGPARKRGKTKDQEHKSAADKGPSLPRADEISRCDVRVTALIVLKIAAEAMSLGSFETLQWELDPERFQPGDEAVSLLEFAETEIIFSEFMRILVHVADYGTCKDAALCERLTLMQRFEGFLRFVLFPACETPYTPPETPAESVHRSDTSHDPAQTDPETASATGQEVTDSASQALDGAQGTEADPAEAEAVQPPEVLDVWHGFEDGSTMNSIAQTPRRWPAGYELQVLKW